MAYAPTQEEAHLEGLRARSFASYNALLGDRDGELAAARKTIGPGSDRWKRRDEQLRDAEEKCRAIFARLLRLTDGKRVPTWAFLSAGFLFAVLEAPINKFMLDNILSGNNLDSYALSLFMTLSLLWLAHVAGTKTRQIYSAYEERIYWSNIVVIIVSLAILITCVAALTIGRAYYSTMTAGPIGNDIWPAPGFVDTRLS